MSTLLIFPHQLHRLSDLPSGIQTFLLIEHPYFFDRFSFHKQKLVFHRASLKAYQSYLESHGRKVTYIPYKEVKIDWIKNVFNELLFIDPIEKELRETILQTCKKAGIHVRMINSPLFLNTQEQNKKFFSKNMRHRMHPFYISQRRRLNIFVTKTGQPIGGTWSFDQKNRQSLPSNVLILEPYKARITPRIQEAIDYIETTFSSHPGNIDNFSYATTHEQATQALEDFLKDRLAKFGPYQDAITTRSSLVFHANLSAYINTGLLTPQEVIQKTLQVAEDKNIAIESTEGFIRQIIGWREYVRALYDEVPNHDWTKNVFNCSNPLPASFYTGTTGIEPVDHVIHSVLESGYAHHIERLMILGNFMLLCEIDPKQVYRWFMEMFIDSYEWVMKANVYGMSQFSDGGNIVTKPYVSSGNYIKKMSDFPNGSWNNVWTALYWRFIEKHKDLLTKQPRMQHQLSILRRMDQKRLKGHQVIAESYLHNLYA